MGNGNAAVEGGAAVGAQVTEKRRVVLRMEKRSATSGRAFFRAAVSILEEVMAFQVIRYSPAWTLSASPRAAFRRSFRASASAWASSMRAWSWRSPRPPSLFPCCDYSMEYIAQDCDSQICQRYCAIFARNVYCVILLLEV